MIAATFATAALTALGLMALARWLVDALWREADETEPGTWHPFD